MKQDVSLINDVVSQVKDDVKDLAAPLAWSSSEGILSIKDDVSLVQQEVRILTERVEELSKLCDQADKEVEWIFQVERKSGSLKAIANDLEGQMEELAQIASDPYSVSMSQDFISMNDEVSQVKEDIKNLTDQMEELAQMGEASQCQCKCFEESLASLSNNETILSLKDDASHVQQEVCNLTGRVEEVSKMSERSLVAHGELKICMENKLESLTALIGDQADKHAKEIETLIDKKSESFKAIARDLQGRFEDLAQIAGKPHSNSIKQDFSSTSDEMNQVKNDVKDFAARVEELAQISEATRLQCNSLEESLASSSNSTSILSLKDDVYHVQQEVRHLTGRVEDLSKVSESSLSLERDNDIWVGHSELKTWMETSLESQAALIRDHEDKHAKKIEELVEWMETSLESQAALIGEDADKHAKEIEAFVAQKSGSFKAMARDLEGRVEEFSWTMASIAGGSDSNRRTSMNDEVNRVKHDVKDLAAQIEELSQMNEASRLQRNSLEESLASSSNRKSILSLIDDVSNVQHEVRKLAGRLEELPELSERSLSLLRDNDIWVAHSELKTWVETSLESLAALMSDHADKYSKEIEALVDKKSESFMAITSDLEGRVETLAQIASELAQIAGGSGSDSMKQDFSSMSNEVNQVKDMLSRDGDIWVAHSELKTWMETSLESQAALIKDALKEEGIEGAMRDYADKHAKEIVKMSESFMAIARDLEGRVEELAQVASGSSMKHDFSLMNDEMNQVKDDIKNLTDQMEELGALVGDQADKHAKEIETLVDKKSESFKVIARDMLGQFEDLTQIAGGPDSNSNKHDSSSTTDEMNQVKNDVKGLAARVEEMVQMSESSLPNSKSMLSLIDDAPHVRRDVMNLTRRVEELPVSERSLTLSRGNDIWVAWMETSLESLTALIGDHAYKHSKEMEALVVKVNGSFKSIARVLEGRAEEVNLVRDDVKHLSAQMQELASSVRVICKSELPCSDCSAVTSPICHRSVVSP